jgi:hypothetical protein
VTITNLRNYVPSASWLVLLHRDGIVVGALAFGSDKRSESYASTFAEAEEVSAILTARQRRLGSQRYPFHRSWLKNELVTELAPLGVEATAPIPLNRMIRARLNVASFLGRPVDLSRAALRWDGRGL